MKMDIAKANCTLAGSVIRQAILDYKFLKNPDRWYEPMPKIQRKALWLDAKDFLYTNRLENYIKSLGIEDLIDANYIRKKIEMGECGYAIR